MFIKMNNITKKFIIQFNKKEKEKKQIIEEEIINYLSNVKNELLFEKIKKYIINNINDVIYDIDDIDLLRCIIEKYGKDVIIKIIKNETENFDFYFKVKRISYTYTLKLIIYFKNFEYHYEDIGDIASFGENNKFNYIFNDKINDDFKIMFKLLFCENNIRETIEKWVYEYKELDDNK